MASSSSTPRSPPSPVLTSDLPTQPRKEPPCTPRTSQPSQRRWRAESDERSAFESVRAIISLLRAYVAARLTPVFGDERGEIASWVVVTALVVAAAIVIVGIVATKLTTTANNIQTP